MCIIGANERIKSVHMKGQNFLKSAQMSFALSLSSPKKSTKLKWCFWKVIMYRHFQLDLFHIIFINKHLRYALCAKTFYNFDLRVSLITMFRWNYNNDDLKKLNNMKTENKIRIQCNSFVQETLNILVFGSIFSKTQQKYCWWIYHL